MNKLENRVESQETWVESAMIEFFQEDFSKEFPDYSLPLVHPCYDGTTKVFRS